MTNRKTRFWEVQQVKFPQMVPVCLAQRPLSEELKTDQLAGVVALDPWLGPYKDALRSRYSKAQEWIKKLNETEGGLEKFSRVRCDLFTPMTASAKCVSTGL